MHNDDLKELRQSTGSNYDAQELNKIQDCIATGGYIGKDGKEKVLDDNGKLVDKDKFDNIASNIKDGKSDLVDKPKGGNKTRKEKREERREKRKQNRYNRRLAHYQKRQNKFNAKSAADLCTKKSAKRKLFGSPKKPLSASTRKHKTFEIGGLATTSGPPGFVWLYVRGGRHKPGDDNQYDRTDRALGIPTSSNRRVIVMFRWFPSI